MRKIYNYTQFNVSERNVFLSWIKDNVIDKLSGWCKEFLSSLKQGKIRTIESGPKKGRPIAMLFTPENGSIVEQLRNYMSMRYTESLETNEAVIPLQHPKYTNVGSETLKTEIMDYFKIKTTMANYYDKPKDQRDAAAAEKGMKAKPIFIYGAPGIGKTEIVAGCCDELNVPLLFLDVQFMNPEDFKGVPSVHEIRPAKVNKETGGIEDPGAGFTRANPPSLFPRDNGKNGKGGIIFMDELNRSQQSVLNTMMQFIQQGRIGEEYVLPNRWCLVAAGNREEDDPDASITPIGTAMASRMSIMNYVPNFDPKSGSMNPDIPEWKAWASKEIGVMPELVSYLTAYSDRFHQNDTSHGGGAFPSPRSWTEASKLLHSRLHINGKKSWRDTTEEFIRLIFEKEVGHTAATEFVSYLSVLKNFSEQDLNNILTDSDKVQIPADLKANTQYIFGLGALMYNRITDKELTPEAFNKVYNLLKYLYRVEGGDPSKSPPPVPTGKGERYGWMFKRFMTKFQDGTNTMNHMQTTDTLPPDLKKKRSQIAEWATSFNKAAKKP